MQSLECAGAAGAVGRNPDVTLEVAHRLAGALAEDTIGVTDVEAQLGEAALKGEHVIPG